MRKKFFQGILLAIIVAVVVREYIKYRVAPDMELYQLKLYTTEGEAIDMEQLKGKPMFVSFYATWCPPCNQEMPLLEDMKTAIGDDMIYLAVSDEHPQKILQYKEKHGSSFDFVIVDAQRSSLGVNTIPTTYIFDKDGQVVFDHVGIQNWSSESMVSKIKKLTGIE